MRNFAFIRGFITVCAVMVICLSLAACGASENSPTAPESTKGYFRDITNVWGTVVDTSYEHATNEISVSVNTDDDQLSVLVTFIDPTIPPYSETELISIADYRILDQDGKNVKEGSTEAAEVVDGQAIINIDLNGLASNNYTLVVSAFEAWELPGDVSTLTLKGGWSIDFSLLKNKI